MKYHLTIVKSVTFEIIQSHASYMRNIFFVKGQLSWIL